MLAICTYSLDKCGPSEILDVEHNHQFTLIKWRGDWKILESSSKNQLEARLAEQTAIAKALERSKKDWVKTFNAMSDWVVLIDLKGRIIRTNRIGENFTGKSLVEIVGQLCCKLVHGSEEHIPGCPLIKMLRTGRQASAELQVPGTDRWLMVTVDPVTNGKGNIVGAVHITRDISERKKAEKKLRESEARYKYLFEQSPLGIGLTTLDGRIVHVNKTMEVITGYFKEELKKINLADTYENPQDRKKLLETIERYGCAVDFPARLKRKDGTLFDALLNVSRVRFGDRDFFQTICMDITERKRAEEALRESEDRYRDLFEAANDIVLAVGANGRIIDINRRAEELTGFTKQELLQKNVLQDLIVQEDKGKVQQVIQNLMKGLGQIYEVRWRTRDGRILHFEGSSSARLTKEGKFVCTRCILRDVTERKRAELELKLHSKIMTNMSEGVYLVRADDGIIAYTNPKFEEMFGYDKGEMIGKHVSIVNTPTDKHPEETAREIIEIMNKEGAWEGEIENIKKDGARFWCFASVTMFDHPEYGRVLVSVHTDITERKRAEEALRESEERYRSLIEHIPSVSWKTDQDGNTIFISPNVEVVYGYTPDEIYNKGDDLWFARVHPNDKEKVKAAFDGLFTKGEKFDVEYRIQRKDGNWIWLHDVAGNISEKDDILYAYGVFSDITERKRAEEQIAKLAKFPAENPNPVLRLSKDCIILYANSASSVVLETWGKKVGERLPQDCCKLVEEALSSGKVSTFEFACHDGRIFGVTLAPVVESGYVNAYGLDITENRQAMEQIEKLAKFPAENQSPVLRISARGTVVYANEASLPLLKIWQCRIGESLPAAWHDIVLDALSSGQSQQTEFKYDGQTFSLVFTPVMDANYVNVYGLDITERKRAEEAAREGRDYLEKLTNSMWDAVFSVKMPERVIEWANDSFRLTGYEPEDYVGSTTEFLYTDRKEYIDFGNKLKKAIEAGEDVLHAEQILRRKNGETFPAEITTTIFREKGRITRVTSIVGDITERKDAEKRLLDYQEQLKSLASQLTLTEEQERRRIATDLHDNITQSLAMSKLKLDLVRDSKSSSSADLAEVLNETSRNIEHIIQEVRTLTFDLSSPILYELGFEAAVAEWLTVRIQKEHGIATEFEDDGQPKPLDDDTRTVLFRDVRELLTNVVKHAQAKKVKVSVRKDRSRICISVEDDGRGFDPEKVAAAAAKNGVFGLFSIRERLKQLGGNIEIESASGQGTRVTLVAPLKSKSLEEKRG